MTTTQPTDENQPTDPGLEQTPPRGVLRHLRPVRDPDPVDLDEPLLPEVLRDRDAFGSEAKRWARRTGYRAARFGLRLPVILWFLLRYSPRGLWRVVARLSSWVYDQDSAELRHHHAGRGETPEAVKVQAMRKANLHARWLIFGTAFVLVAGPILAWVYPYVLSAIVGAVFALWLVKVIPGKHPAEIPAALGAGVLTWYFLPYALALIPQPPAWVFWLVGTASVLGLGWVGRPEGRTPLKDSNLHAPGVVEKPSANMVVDALVASVPGITDKNRGEIRVFTPGVARSRRGYHLAMELPPGVTATAAIENREPLAGAMRRPLGTVWPSKGRMHPGHLELFLSDMPMATADQARWPLLDGEEVDIFRPLPLVTDQEGRWVDVTFAYNQLVVGGAPGYGKSFAIREFGVATAFDPRVRITTLDGKGNGDLRPLRLVAHGFYEGDEPDEIAEQLAAVKAIREEMRRRARFLRDLPKEQNPLNKVTSELVDRYPHLAPIVLIIDEVQVYTEYGDKAIRAEFVATLTDLVKRGRSAGIIPIFATQKPDASSLPSAIADNCSARLCFRVNSASANNQVLGNGSYAAGVNACQFSAEDRGLAWLRGDGADPQVVRTVFGLDAIVAEELMVKARAIREAKGLLSGYAAGEEAKREDDQVRLLDDARFVMDEAGADRMHLATLLDALALLRPGIYGVLDVEGLGAALRAAGVSTGQVKVDGKNTTGVRRAALNVAATSDVDPDEGDEEGDVVVPIR